MDLRLCCPQTRTASQHAVQSVTTHWNQHRRPVRRHHGAAASPEMVASSARRLTRWGLSSVPRKLTNFAPIPMAGTCIRFHPTALTRHGRRSSTDAARGRQRAFIAISCYLLRRSACPATIAKAPCDCALSTLASSAGTNFAQSRIDRTGGTASPCCWVRHVQPPPRPPTQKRAPLSCWMNYRWRRKGGHSASPGVQLSSATMPWSAASSHQASLFSSADLHLDLRWRLPTSRACVAARCPLR